jgi:hypothetical protein
LNRGRGQDQSDYPAPSTSAQTRPSTKKGGAVGRRRLARG